GLPLIWAGPGLGSSLARVEADLLLDDLPQRGVLGGQLLQRLDQRTIAPAQLLHAARNHVDQDVGILDLGERQADIVVSHGSGRMLLREKRTQSGSLPGESIPNNRGALSP